MMNIDCHIKSKKEIASDTWEVTFSHSTELFYFNAGQYIWVITPFGRRAFSLASSSKTPGTLSIVFRNRKKSKFKEYLLNLDENEKVILRGPSGTLRAPQENIRTIYVAGGVGIAPVMSILRSLSDTEKIRDVVLVYANHDINDTAYLDELKRYAKDHRNFKLISIYGKVSKSNLSDLDYSNSNVCVFGPTYMVSDVTKILTSLGVDPKKVCYEENFPDVIPFTVSENDTSVFKNVVNQSATHVVITDANGIIVYANPSAESMTGYTFKEMAGQTPRLWGGLMDAEIYKKMWNTIKIDRKPFKGELTNIRKNGDKYDVLATISPIFDEDKSLVGFMGIEEDITQEKKTKVDLEKISKLFLDKMTEN